MDQNNTVLLDTKKTMNNFLLQMRNDIKQGTFSSKEDLLREIDDFKTFLKDTPKTEDIRLQDFDKEILELLETYDQNNKANNPKDFSNYSEFQRENGVKGATMKIGEEQYTIKQLQGEDKDISEEMNDIYNKEAIQNPDMPLQDTVENNFELLRKYKNEEVVMTDNKLDMTPTIFSIPKKALQYYMAKNGLQMQFSSDGLGRDQNGIMYEATVSMTGEITIYKTKRTTIENGNPSTEEKVELEVIPMRELIEFEKTKPLEQQTINMEFLAFLKAHLNNYGYRDILNDPSAHLSEEQKQMYEDLLKEDMETKRREEIMTQQKDKPKVYVLEQKKEGRNGFVNALLLSIITSLFGGLCLTYFLMGILA